MKWTKEQQEAIDYRGSDLLVSAAAGSGKTAVLIERIAKMILNGETEVDKILVVTFTRAAAAEMKEKLTKKLHEKLNEDNLSAKEKSMLRNQLAKLHRASIQTLDSFALDIIRKYFYTIDLDPKVDICDETDAAIMKNEAMNELFTRYFVEKNPDFLTFINAFSGYRNEDAIKALLIQTHSKINSFVYPMKETEELVEYLNSSAINFLHSNAMNAIFDKIEAEIGRILNNYYKCRELLSEYGCEEFDETKFGHNGEFLAVLENLDVRSDFDNTIQVLADFDLGDLRSGSGKNENYKLIRDEFKDLFNDAKEWRKKIVNDFGSTTYQQLIDEMNVSYGDAHFVLKMLQDFSDIIATKKEEAGCVEFSDIQHFAIAVLEHQEVANELREKYDFIFVDEYQDTNRLQDEIIRRIKRENNLFMVGDVKQCIYRFRQAVPQLFKDKYAHFMDGSENGKCIVLDKNFRSKESIIDAVNAAFEPLMGKDYQALKLGLESTPDFTGDVSMTVIDSSNMGELKAVEAEAKAMAAKIHELLGQDIYDAKKNEIRKIQKKDIVVLLRSAKDKVQYFYEIFKDAGIESYVDDKKGYFQTIEIMTFTSLLKVIDNSRNDLELLSVLRSAMFGFNITELASIRIANKNGAFRDALKAYAKGGEDSLLREKCILVNRKLAEWKERSIGAELDEFLWYLMCETSYYEYVGSLPNGAQRQRNMRALIDRAITFKNRIYSGLHSWIAYVDQLTDNELDMGEPTALSEEDDVVRIMTIHKSKGLEFPVVLLGQMFSVKRNQNTIDMWGINKEIGFGIDLRDESGTFKRNTIMQKAIKVQNGKELLEEAICILYVAMTRAQDQLHMFGAERKVKDLAEMPDEHNKELPCYYDLVMKNLLKANVPIWPITEEEQLETDNDDSLVGNGLLEELLEEADDSDEIQRRNAKEIIEANMSFKYPYENDTALKSKYSVSELNKNSDFYNFPLKKPEFMVGKGKLTAAEIGLGYHSLMEHLDFRTVAKKMYENRAAALAYITDVLESLTSKAIVTEEQARKVNFDFVISFFETDIGRRAAKAPLLEKEKPFNCIYNIDGADVMVQGIIDCYFEDEEGLVLVDYKTNNLREELEEKYRKQIEIYRAALEQTLGKKVDESYLFLFRDGSLVKM